MREIKLQDLKLKSPTELLAFAEEHEVENASIMRKQELMFARSMIFTPPVLPISAKVKGSLVSLINIRIQAGHSKIPSPLE